MPMPVAIDITIIKKHATYQGLFSISTFSFLLGDIIHHRPYSADSNASGRPTWQ